MECKVEECRKRVHAKGACIMHYHRLRRHGSYDPPPQAQLPAIERFERRVERIPFSDCEYWMGAVDLDGYGRLGVAEKVMSTHRFIWEYHNGPVPEGLQVNHKCNKGHLGCVALHHLKLGTQADNMEDMARAGTSSMRKLSDAEVVEIRKSYAAGGVTQYQLAEDYGVTQPQISRIVRGKNRAYAHAT